MEDQILTQHPQGRRGVSMSKAKYDMVRETILGLIRDYGEISSTELLMRCEQLRADSIKDSLSWHVTRVKLDLESRGEIERVPEASPQKIRLKQT
jgi:Family of unknown function (DUF6958)